MKLQRIAKLNLLKDKGIASYASPDPGFIPVQEAVSLFVEGAEPVKVSVCGRITAKRSHGKVSFLDIRDCTGRIQLYVKKDVVGDEAHTVFECTDIADFLQVWGEVFKTHTGEITIKVLQVKVLAKALLPLPEKWHGLKDVEVRYRQRYLDLVSNEEVRKVFVTRAKVIHALRSHLDGQGYLEVETPMMHDIPGGAAGRPFRTHHNEYDMPLYMRIAPELFLKRLLVGGFDRVYEINRSFRNEGVSTRHNPEFTMLEVYRAYANYRDMMQLSVDLLVGCAIAARGSLQFEYQGKPVDLSPPWKEVSFAQVVKDKFGIVPEDAAETMLAKLQAKGFAREAARLSRTQVTKLMEDVLQEEVGFNPTFVTDYFTSMSPLAMTRKDNPLISERFELYCGGMEIGNAYTELNNPLEQRQRFEEEIKDLPGEEKKSVDEDYCTALEHGMPPAGGLGLGVDRVVMLLSGQESIREVILFPLLKPSQEEPK